MMACVLLPLVVTILLTEASGSLSFSDMKSAAAGTEQAASCPPRWLLIGQRCFAFYPVWSSWSAARALCSQTGGDLASLHTPEERQLVRQVARTHTAVWLGGHQDRQNGSWLWSDSSPFRISDWTNQTQEKTREGGACMQMTPKSGELHSAPCGELRFYICSTCTSSKAPPSNRKPGEPGLVPNVSLFDVVWAQSDLLAEEILHSSSFLQKLWSGQLTQRCYTSFIQQEALYLHRVSITLEALISSLQEVDVSTSLLLDSLKHYSSRNQSLLTSPPPQWLQSSLRSFHSVVLEEPVYWLVALSARACLWDFLTRKQPSSEPGVLLESESEVEAGSFYQEWSEAALREVAWTHRYRKVLSGNQDHMDVFKAINIFREHMMNQKSFYKAADCDV